ncbi:MAG: twin-arginine translocase TatA/TatE family subunit [Gemmatimonadota bacterium]|nr:twin-arginine translocase TatA/TatE family subunit [Gemmatimonadota bacterium]
MPFNLGMTELLVILVVLLLVFGAKRLPEIGSSMGKGIREFKKSISDVKDSIEDDVPPPRKLDAPPETNREGEPKKLSE